MTAEATVVLEGVASPAGSTGWVRVDNGQVSEVGSGFPTADTSIRRILLNGAAVTRGFSDLHCHGAGGVAFDAGDRDDLRRALAVHRKHGTREGLLSLVSGPIDVLTARLRQLATDIPHLPGARGIHLEGPFLAPTKRGAHDLSALTEPRDADVDALIEASGGHIRMITMAPELPGALAAIRRLTEAGIVVAVGHTEATYDEAAAAFDTGARLLTHTFNAMPALHHRAPGPIGAALDRSHVILEAIADGHHLHASVLRMLFSAAPDRIALVSDAMSATGCADGAFTLGGLDVDVRIGVPYLSGTNTLAGSTLTLDAAVGWAVASGVPFLSAVQAATTVPSAVLHGVAADLIGADLSDLVIVHPSGHISGHRNRQFERSALVARSVSISEACATDGARSVGRR